MSHGVHAAPAVGGAEAGGVTTTLPSFRISDDDRTSVKPLDCCAEIAEEREHGAAVHLTVAPAALREAMEIDRPGQRAHREADDRALAVLHQIERRDDARRQERRERAQLPLTGGVGDREHLHGQVADPVHAALAALADQIAIVEA